LSGFDVAIEGDVDRPRRARNALRMRVMMVI